MLDSGIPRVHVLKKGGSLELKCAAVGDPEPTLWWYKAGINLLNGGLPDLWISADRKILVSASVFVRLIRHFT